MKIDLPPQFPCKCGHVAAKGVVYSSTSLNLACVYAQHEMTHAMPGENDIFEADLHAPRLSQTQLILLETRHLR